MGSSLGTIIVIALIAIPCYFGLKRIARSFSHKGGCGCDSGSSSGSCGCNSSDSGHKAVESTAEKSCCCCGGSAQDCKEEGHENDAKFNANCTQKHSLNGSKHCCHDK